MYRYTSEDGIVFKCDACGDQVLRTHSRCLDDAFRQFKKAGWERLLPGSKIQHLCHICNREG